MKKLVILLLCLSACSSLDRANLAIYKRQCASYGFVDGTEQMSQCLMTTAENYHSHALNAINTLNATTRIFQPIQPQTQQIKMNCMTSSFAGMGNINCY